MTPMILLIALAVLVVASLSWLVSILVRGNGYRNPPRHAESSWSAYGLPSRPFAAE